MKPMILAISLLCTNACGALKEDTEYSDTFAVMNISLEPCFDTCDFEDFDSYFRVMTTGEHSGWKLNPTTTGMYLTSEQPHLKRIENKTCVNKRNEDNCKINSAKYELYLPACSTYRDTRAYKLADDTGFWEVIHIENDKVVMICIQGE